MFKSALLSGLLVATAFLASSWLGAGHVLAHSPGFNSHELSVYLHRIFEIHDSDRDLSPEESSPLERVTYAQGNPLSWLSGKYRYHSLEWSPLARAIIQALPSEEVHHHHEHSDAAKGRVRNWVASKFREITDLFSWTRFSGFAAEMNGEIGIVSTVVGAVLLVPIYLGWTAVTEVIESFVLGPGHVACVTFQLLFVGFVNYLVSLQRRVRDAAEAARHSDNGSRVAAFLRTVWEEGRFRVLQRRALGQLPHDRTGEVSRREFRRWFEAQPVGNGPAPTLNELERGTLSSPLWGAMAEFYGFEPYTPDWARPSDDVAEPDNAKRARIQRRLDSAALLFLSSLVSRRFAQLRKEKLLLQRDYLRVRRLQGQLMRQIFRWQTLGQNIAAETEAEPASADKVSPGLKSIIQVLRELALLTPSPDGVLNLRSIEPQIGEVSCQLALEQS